MVSCQVVSEIRGDFQDGPRLGRVEMRNILGITKRMGEDSNVIIIISGGLQCSPSSDHWGCGWSRGWASDGLEGLQGCVPCRVGRTHVGSPRCSYRSVVLSSWSPPWSQKCLHLLLRVQTGTVFCFVVLILILNCAHFSVALLSFELADLLSWLLNICFPSAHSLPPLPSPALCHKFVVKVLLWQNLHLSPEIKA